MSTEAGLVIDVEDLRKSFKGKPAVRGLTLKVREGDIFGFLGPNGSGKTTTIRMICGLLTPDAGRGTCLGYDLLRQSSLIRESVGYMTQRFSLYEDLTVRENLDFIARMYGIRSRRETVERTLVRFGLMDRHAQLAGTLSGGWKQRLALAASLIHGPRVLLLDEPTAGVDPRARREFWDQIHGLAAEGVTALVSTHYMDEAEHCNKLAYVAAGEILAYGEPAAIIDRSGLVTWVVTGDGLWEFSKRMAGLPGVDNVAAFGASLHVSGYDEAALERSLRDVIKDGHNIKRIRPGLEDVFIALMRGPDRGVAR